MSKVEGQWVVEVNGNDIDAEELAFVVIREKVGLELPTLKLQFSTADIEKVKRYTKPGFIVNVGIGRKSPDTIAEFRLYESAIVFASNDRWRVEVDGILNVFDYLVKQHMEHYNTWEDLKKSSEVWEEVMGRAGLSPDTKPSNDEMLWIQPNTTDIQFLREVTWHGWYGANDPPLTAIRRDKKAIYKPLSDLKVKSLSFGNDKGADILTNHCTISQKEGVLTSFSGKTRRTPVHDTELGVTELDDSTVVPLVSNAIGIEDTDKTSEFVWFTENMHEHWYDAYRQNLQYKSSLSSVSLSTDFTDYYDIYCLDCLEGKYVKNADESSLLPLNGLWMVSSVVISVINGRFKQSIEVRRETLL